MDNALISFCGYQNKHVRAILKLPSCGMKCLVTPLFTWFETRNICSLIQRTKTMICMKLVMNIWFGVWWSTDNN